ncbi:MAG: hypothetical protein HRF50_18125 [Phycisphaerae bacterium]
MRNLILVLATLGVVALLFVGYVKLTAVKVQSGVEDARTEKPLPQAVRDPAQNIQVGPVDVPPGEEFSFVVYDERTGRPTDRFRCKQWRKVAGSENEVTVTEPELSMLLPSGMLATITADAGRIVVDRIDTRRMRPKLGWLSGNARIVIDRETAADRTPAEQRPDDLVTIAAEKFAFDLEVGKVQLDGALHVASAEFEISGTGLELVWNQVGNRVERLVIQRGEKMEVQLSRGMPAGLRDAARPDRRDPTTSRPADALVDGRAARAPHARATSYRLTLTGGVNADHLRGEQRVGGLKSEELTLLFDAGGGPGAATQSAPSSQPATQSAPASGPAATQPAPPEKLVVRWGGLLTLDPVGTRDPTEPARRQLEATGQIVTLEFPDGTVRCGGLRYEDESQRAWLRPADAGRVEIVLNQRVGVEAASVFIDRSAGVAKLIGPVTMKSASRGEAREALAISCGLWAELHLAARGKPAEEGVAPGQLIDAAELKSAIFNGDVRVQLGDRRLHAIKLETRFRPPAGNQGLDELLDEVIATGSVRMTAGRGDGVLPRWARVVPDRIERLLHADESQEGLLGPGDTQGLECASVRMRFQRDPAGRAYVSAVSAEGAVRLVDLEYEVRANGQSLDADVAQSEQITRATVRGTPGKPAVVQAQDYVVHGETVHFDEVARTMEVPGPSHLSFESDRTLRGEQQSRGQRVAVRSSRSLRVDGANNRIDFIGDVVAQSQQDQLLAESLTLLLKDVPAPAARPGPFASLRDAIAAARPALPGTQPARSPPASGERRERLRKEPARLLAQRAVIQSETYRPGDRAPIVHQSVAAPELEVDIATRLLRTTGETTLLMTSRQLDVDAAAVREATGLPSSLMSRGPSQTAMRCARSMTYVLGPDGPQRRDSVLFEGEVRFRHVAGRQMVGWEELLPEASRNPELLKKVRDRNTYMECDRLEGAFVSPEQRPGAGAAARSNLSLAWLNAIGNVYMRDEQGPGVREIQAHQVEFDRPNGKVRVLGNKQDGRLARVWYQNTQTGQFDNPAAGPEFIIDLNTNTLKAGATTGEFRRP